MSTDVDDIVERCGATIAPSLRYEYEETLTAIRDTVGERTAQELIDYICEQAPQNGYPRPGVIKEYADQELGVAADVLPRYEQNY